MLLRLPFCRHAVLRLKARSITYLMYCSFPRSSRALPDNKNSARNVVAEEKKHPSPSFSPLLFRHFRRRRELSPEMAGQLYSRAAEQDGCAEQRLKTQTAVILAALVCHFNLLLPFHSSLPGLFRAIQLNMRHAKRDTTALMPRYCFHSTIIFTTYRSPNLQSVKLHLRVEPKVCN